MSTLFLLMRRAPLQVFCGLILGLASGACGAGMIILINQALAGGDSTRMSKLAAGFTAVCVLRLITSVGSEHLFHRFSQRTAYELRTSLARQILAAPLRRLEEAGLSRLLAVLTVDVSALVGAIGGFPAVLMDLSIVVGCLAYLSWLRWELLVVLLLFFGLAALPQRLIRFWGRRWLRRHRQRHDALYQHFETVTRGTKELKLHHERRHSFLDGALTKTASEMRSLAVAGGSLFGVVINWAQLLVILYVGFLIFVLREPVGLGLGLVRDTTLLILFMSGPLNRVVLGVPRLGASLINVRSIESLDFDLEQAPVEPATPASAPQSWRRLELVGVQHSYHREADGGRFTLGPVDLAIEAGEMVFIVGGNGSGKTTLAKILSGLYEPEKGKVQLDGEVVGAERREDYRQLFSAVFWDFYLFRELPGLAPELLQEKGQDFIEALQLERKVSIRDGELSTIDLSRGQRKRLALLTAFLEDRQIYLFDEWAADQDPAFKEVFYRQVLPALEKRGKTVIVISHDDRYYDLADRIVKLEDGRIISDHRSAPRLAEG